MHSEFDVLQIHIAFYANFNVSMDTKTTGKKSLEREEEKIKIT